MTPKYVTQKAVNEEKILNQITDSRIKKEKLTITL